MKSSQSLRIVVTGLIAQHPTLGGVTWDYVQYPLGLSRLGHDVYYIEDTGEWPYTVNGGPTREDRTGEANVAHLAAVMERFGLGSRWAYRFPIKPTWFGMSPAKRNEVLRTADVLINVSGTLRRPSDYRRIPRLVYVDSDPVFTQIKLAMSHGQRKFQKRVRAHDVHFSFGERLSAFSALAPTPYAWQPTRQPVVLSEWNTLDRPRPVYTTIMSWTSYRSLLFRGERYGQKDLEFRRFLDLPARVPELSMEVALNATAHVVWEEGGRKDRSAAGPRVEAPARLSQAGWHVVEARDAAAGLDRYRSYVQESRGEWSVAKSGYVKGAPGWFSCRSACYLAAGRPVVVQDTGFRDTIPTGNGLLAFSSLEGAAEALRSIERDYERHAREARELASAYFDSNRVLTDLIERAMALHTATPATEVVA